MKRPALLAGGAAFAALGMSLWGGGSVGASVPATYDQISFAPAPIAANGSLTSGEAVTVCVQAKEDGTLVSGASIYLSIASNDIPAGDTGGGGTAAVGVTALSSSPGGPFPASSSCTPSGTTSVLPDAVAITYDAPADGGSNNGAPFPVWGGRDIITGQNASSGATVTNTVQYEFSPVTQYAYSLSPIGPAGSLTAGSPVALTITASGTGGPVSRRFRSPLADQHRLSRRDCDRHWVRTPQRHGLHDRERADTHLDALTVHHQRERPGGDQLHPRLDDLRGDRTSARRTTRAS